MADGSEKILYEFTPEQIELLEKYLTYNSSNYQLSSQENFIIPLIQTAGGIPAQIRAASKGLYKDIQRSPFMRKSGVFDENGSIPDIDISPLIYYGTLEQAKIAPTLENIDVRLYYREPKLTRVPDNRSSVAPNSYADNYIWREIPVGFHVYNNDTVYGYEWLVLQADYVAGAKKEYLTDASDGIYNLHMNIEDGLGVCKFAGTQAPISLKGVQYKIIVTAKSLWNREYSLLESIPLSKTLSAVTDELAPSVNAVREYYQKALHTKEVITDTIFVGPFSGNGWKDTTDPLLSNTEDGIYIKRLTLGEITDAEAAINVLDETLQDHIDSTIDGGLTGDNGKAVGVHGILNKGAEGNLDAKTLAGASLSNGAQSVEKNVDSLSYIPFVDENDTIGLGTVIKQYKRSSGKNPVPYYQTTLNASDTDKTLYLRKTSLRDEVSAMLESLSVGSTLINFRYATVSSVPTITVSGGRNENEAVTLDISKIATQEINMGGGFKITANKIQQWDASSSIAKKNVHSELLGINVKTAQGAIYSDLEPNIGVDADGNKVTTLHTIGIEDAALKVPDLEDAAAWTKLGSALQALYELPLGTYQYKRGGNEYKEQLGLFVERVNQFRDHLLDLAGAEIETENNGVPAESNYVVHKRNTWIKSKHTNVRNREKGLGELAGTKDAYRVRVDNNSYSYTKEELKSIVNYLNLLTSKDELAQELRNTVGVLLVAAKETQERLLDVETAVYGWDAKTVPGNDEGKQKFVESQIAESLRDQLVNSPLLLGLNRLMRALLLEIYDTTDLEQIDAEIESRVTDSDGLAEKVTVKSRMDQIDEIMSVLYSQQSAMIKFYVENVLKDESSHSYTDIVDINGNKRITGLQLEELADFWTEEYLKDDHTEQKDRDEGRTWKNLPSDKDVADDVKNAVGFAQVADSAHKHTPNLNETGLVRVPVLASVDTDNVSEGDVEHLDKSEYSGETNRYWDLFKLDKSKKEFTDDYASAGSYLPYFRTKSVAWDSAKLERVNKKLSEVTKTIYGTDDVTMKYPNRTEVLRRNITNLVDDLYPNRSFRIENPIKVANDSTADLYLPFKTSNKQDVQNATTSSVTDEPETRQHTSIVTWFDNEIFNFKIVNHFIGKSLKSSTGIDNYAANKQIDLSERDKYNLIFSTEKLVTDVKSFDEKNYGTYQKAYSRIDMLENLLGVQDCYITDLYGDENKILDVNSNFVAALDKLALGYTSTQQVLNQQELINQTKANLATLQYQRENVATELETVEAELRDLQTALTSAQTVLSKLQSESFDPVSASATAAAAQKNCEDLEKAVVSKEEDIKSLQTQLSTSSTELEAAKVNVREKDIAIQDAKDSLELIATEAKSLQIRKNSADGVLKIYAAYKPLDESKSFILRNWIDKQKDSDTTAKEFSKLGAFTTEETVFDQYGSVESSSDSETATTNGYKLKIEKTYTKHTTSTAEKPTHGGTVATEESIYTYKLCTDYFTRSDTTDAIFYDSELKRSIQNFVIQRAGDCTELELEPAVTEEIETKTVDAEGKEVVTKETRVTKEAVYLRTYTNAVVWIRDAQYAGGEILVIDKLVYNLENEKYYELVDDSDVRCTLKEITDLVATDLHEATDFTSTKDVILDSLVLEKDAYSNYVLVENAKTFYKLVTLPDKYVLDYEIKYSLEWEGSTETPRSLNTEYSYPRVYTWRGSATVSDLEDENQTVAFSTTLESFVCDTTTIWEKIDEAVEETTKDLENSAVQAAQIVAVEDIEDAELKAAEDAIAKQEAELAELQSIQASKEKLLEDTQNRLNQAEVDLQTLKDQLTTAQEDLQNCQTTLTNLGEAKAQNEQQQDEIKAQITDLQTNVTKDTGLKNSLTSSLANLDNSIASTEATLVAQQKVLADLGNSAVDLSVLPYYANELRYTNFVKQKGSQKSLDYVWQLSEDIQKSSNVGYVLSRKSKSIQERLTTTEAFLDILAKGFNYEVNLRNEKVSQENKAASGELHQNAPFEGVNPWKSLKRIFDTAENKQLDHRIYDLDLSESWNEESVDFTEHNRKVWQVMRFSRYATKTSFTLSTASHIVGSYEINNIQLAADPELLPYQDSKYLAGWSKFNVPGKTIKVVYLAKGQTTINLSNAAVDTIYLSGKTPTATYKNFYMSSNTDAATTFLNTASSLGWQNQTEYNVYKTISNLFTSLFNSGKVVLTGTQDDNNLYFKFMKLVYPIGSVYMDTIITGRTLQDPNNLFGGKWLRVQDSVVEAAITPNTVVATSGYIGINSATNISENQLAPHKHAIGDHTHYMRHEHTFNTDNNNSQNTRVNSTGSTSASGSGGGSNFKTKDCDRNYTAASSGDTSTLPTPGTQIPLTVANVPNFKVAVWVRIA